MLRDENISILDLFSFYLTRLLRLNFRKKYYIDDVLVIVNIDMGISGVRRVRFTDRNEGVQVPITYKHVMAMSNSR